MIKKYLVIYFVILSLYIPVITCYARDFVQEVEQESYFDSPFNSYEFDKKVELIKEEIAKNWQEAPSKNKELGYLLLQLSKEENDFRNKAFAYKIIGRSCYNLEFYQEAIWNYQSALRITRQHEIKDIQSDLLYNLGLVFLKRNELEKSLNYFNEALVIDSERENHSGVVTCYNSIGNVYIQLGKSAEAESYYLLALERAKEFDVHKEECQILMNLGRLHFRGNQNKFALSYFQDALKKAIENKELYCEATAKSLIADVFEKEADDADALKYKYEALRIFKKLNRGEDVVICLLSIGDIYLNRYQYEKALNSYTEALTLSKQDKLERVSNLYQKLGTVNFMLGNYSQSEKSFQKGREALEQLNDLGMVANSLEMEGILFSKQDKYEDALKNYRAALRIRKELKDTSGLANVQYNTSLVLLKKGDLTQAKRMLDESFDMAISNHYSKLILNCYSAYVDYFSTKKEYDKGLIYHKLYTQMKDSLFTMQSSLFIEELQTKYETEQKQRLIEQQDYELSTVKANIKIRNLILLLFSIAGLLILVFVVHLLITKKKLKRHSLELNAKNQELEELSEFKEEMSNMLVHDLKTPLSLILNIGEFPAEDRVDLVRYAGNRQLSLIENILDVYKYENVQMELQLSEFCINEEISKINKELEFAMHQSQLALAFNHKEQLMIEADKALFVRIIQNLLSNAMKFANSGSVISIDVREEKGTHWLISVHNFGIPISKEKQASIFERFEQDKKRSFSGLGSTGLGLTFCKMAVQAHKGNISVESDEERGTSFSFSLPKYQNTTASVVS